MATQFSYVDRLMVQFFYDYLCKPEHINDIKEVLKSVHGHNFDLLPRNNNLYDPSLHDEIEMRVYTLMGTDLKNYEKFFAALKNPQLQSDAKFANLVPIAPWKVDKESGEAKKIKRLLKKYREGRRITHAKAVAELILSHPEIIKLQ